MRYGIYFIPDESTEFYKIGSKILGYDIRNRKIIALRQNSAHFFGFHATIRGIFKTSQIECVQKDIKKICLSFEPLRLENSYLYSFNKFNRSIRFKLNRISAKYLYELHFQVVEVIERYRIKTYISPETRTIISSLKSRELELLEQYGDPRVLDGYIFHFTLANRASTKEILEIDKLINEEKEKLINKDILVDRLSIVYQEKEDRYWKIMNEFSFERNSLV